MTWHCQRPNIAYNENRLFDKHFEQLFKSDYLPIDILGLKFWASKIEDRWNAGDLPLNEALLASPSYSKFHLFYAVQIFFSAASTQIDKVPFPSATVNYPDADALISLAANCYNSALEKGKIFSPPNWLKAKDSLLKLQASVRIVPRVLGRNAQRCRHETGTGVATGSVQSSMGCGLSFMRESDFVSAPCPASSRQCRDGELLLLDENGQNGTEGLSAEK